MLIETGMNHPWAIWKCELAYSQEQYSGGGKTAGNEWSQVVKIYILLALLLANFVALNKLLPGLSFLMCKMGIKEPIL